MNTYLHLPERGEVERRKQLSMDPELEVERLKTRVHTLEKELKCKGNNTYKVLKCWKFGKRRIYIEFELKNVFLHLMFINSYSSNLCINQQP